MCASARSARVRPWLSRASWGLAAAVVGTLATPRVDAGTRDVDDALQAMTAVAGGPVRVTRASATGTVSFLAAPTGAAIPIADASAVMPEARARAFATQYATVFGLADQSDLQVTKVSSTDAVGMDHVRLQQRYRGVLVTGAEMTVHLRGAGVVSVLAKTLPDLSGIDVTPRLDAPAASSVALKAATKGNVAPTGADARNPRLEIFNRGLLEGSPGVTRLAWFVEVVGEGLREYVWVDARRGVVLLQFSQLTEARTRQVFTANSGSVLPGASIRSEGQPPTGDPDADTAYDFSGDTYDYFLAQHGRDSFDGAGAPILSTVHFCPSSAQCPYPNAAWNGTQMIYGNGFSRADDVDAHELTHAVTERTANLFYYMQSGALNESISDMFGETVDLTNGKGNDDGSVRWLMGEEVPGIGALRSLTRPSQFGDPERVSDPAYLCAVPDNGGVHTNSGVTNHAYALMVDGGTYNGHASTGIGLTKAEKIVYRALTSYLTSASNLRDFYDSVGQSCADLTGGPSLISVVDCAQVQEALDAVELAVPPCGGGPASIPPSCPLDPYSPTFYIPLFQDNLEGLSSGNWSTGYSTGGNHWAGGAGAPDIYWTGFSTSGGWSFWGYDVPARGDSWVAMNRSVFIPPGAHLQFRHFFGFETPYDGGLVEYSFDDGLTWLPTDQYFEGPGRGLNALVPLGHGNPLQGQSVFSGQSFGYTFSRINLGFAEGRSVRFRFRIGTDRQIGDIGWFIDDVEIYHCLARPLAWISDATVTEGDTGTTPAVFFVSLPGPFPLPLSLDFSAETSPANFQATANVDFVPVAGRLDFPPGVTLRAIAVPIRGDFEGEGNESFSVQITETGGFRGGVARGMIVDNDPIGVAVADTSVLAPRSGSVNAVFEVSNTLNPYSLTVAFQTHDGTAAAPLDYTPISGTLTFAPLETSKTVSVPVGVNPAGVSGRTFFLDLSNSSNPDSPVTRARGTATLYERGLYPLAPCRLLDTRDLAQGPALSGGAIRTVVIGGKCGIPPTATAVSLNLTVVSPTSPGDLRIFASGPAPLVSAINYAPGQVRANNAVVPLTDRGWLSIFCDQLGGVVDVVIDVNGFLE